MLSQNTPNAKRLLNSNTPKATEKYKRGSQGFHLGSHYGVETQHTQAQSIFHLGQRAPGLFKGKCQSKAYESLCCVVWQSRAQTCHQLSISRYTGKERKFSQRATLLLWLSYFLNDSSFWLISLRAWELSCPSTQKNGGDGTPLQLHKVGEKRTGLKLPLGEELGTRK